VRWLTCSKGFSLTLAYAAPECFDGTTSFRSDQYSLAVSYCYLRGGRLPFDGTYVEIIDGHRMKSSDLSMLPECERFAVAKALEKLPKNRWPNSANFVQALREANEKTDSPLHTASQSTDVTRRVLLVGSVCSALLLLSIFTGIVLRPRKDSDSSKDIGVDANQNENERSNSTLTPDNDSTNHVEVMPDPSPCENVIGSMASCRYCEIRGHRLVKQRFVCSAVSPTIATRVLIKSTIEDSPRTCRPRSHHC